MIKIENPDIDKIAKKYFDKIKVGCIDRSEYYSKVLEVLQTPALVNLIATGGPHGTIKKTLINKLLSINKITNQHQFHQVIFANCHAWVTANFAVLQAIATYLSDEDNLLELIIAQPTAIAAIQNQINLVTGITAVNFEQVKPFVEAIMDYNYFKELAYEIATEIGINTCPYCNRNYINTIVDKKGKSVIRPTFDHFFSQKENPLLSLSFFNLVPSCYYCNSSLKNVAGTTLDTHMHPYIEGFDNDSTFHILIKSCRPKKSDPANYKIFFKDNIDPAAIHGRYRKIFGGTKAAANDDEGNINLFKLEEIYQSHLDIVGELVVKCDALSSGYSDSLFKMFRLLNSNKSEFYQYYFGNYFNEKDFNRRPLSKMTKDIISQVLPNFTR